MDIGSSSHTLFFAQVLQRMINTLDWLLNLSAPLFNMNKVMTAVRNIIFRSNEILPLCAKKPSRLGKIPSFQSQTPYINR